MDLTLRYTSFSLPDDKSAGQLSAAPQPNDHYPYTILHKITSFFHNSSSNADNQSFLQDQKPYTATVKERETKDPFLKRILIVDDEPDVALTFKVGLEGYHYGNHHDNSNKIRFEAHTYNNPVLALSEFKPHFYGLMLVDVYMQHMNGFQLCEKILEQDVNIRAGLIISEETNSCI
jgi:CheY-like chemotaxis protein